MEFAQYYRQDDGPQAFDFSPYNFSSEPPMLPHQHYDSNPLGPLGAQSMQPNDDRDLAGQKEDEVDASSRPRLTTEQTNVLEEHFQRESKPITEVKKQLAAQVGLPLDKVNVSDQSTAENDGTALGSLLTSIVELVSEPKGQSQASEEARNPRGHAFPSQSCRYLDLWRYNLAWFPPFGISLVRAFVYADPTINGTGGFHLL